MDWLYLPFLTHYFCKKYRKEINFCKIKCCMHSFPQILNNFATTTFAVGKEALCMSHVILAEKYLNFAKLSKMYEINHFM